VGQDETKMLVNFKEQKWIP